jgi:hypothetical protein
MITVPNFQVALKNTTLRDHHLCCHNEDAFLDFVL